jgi:hypothetical protein
MCLFPFFLKIPQCLFEDDFSIKMFVVLLYFGYCLMFDEQLLEVTSALRCSSMVKVLRKCFEDFRISMFDWLYFLLEGEEKID